MFHGFIARRLAVRPTHKTDKEVIDMTSLPYRAQLPRHFALVLSAAMLFIVVLGSYLPYDVRGAESSRPRASVRRNRPVRPGLGGAR